MCVGLNILTWCVLLISKDNLFTLNHSANDAISWLTSLYNSANSIHVVHRRDPGRSFEYRMKRSGHNTDPWGTPQVMGNNFESIHL